MSRFRQTLVWLLCALLIGAGVPLRASAPCAADATGTSSGSCCGTDACRCADMTPGSNCCGDRRAPLPEAPPAPSPQQDAVTVPELEPLTTMLPATVHPRAAKSTAAAPRACAFAARSRQEVLLVWRL